MITVSIVKDDKLIREALKDLINEADGFECIEIYECGAPMSFKIPKLVVSSFQKKTETTLTQREFDVLDQLCMGHSYKEIAYKLLNTVGTVRHHLKNIYYKLHVHSKSEAVAKALKERIV